jgi:hypothetical protein
MYEIHSQQRRMTRLENKLSQQMLQHSRYAENQTIRGEKVERQ